MLSAGSIATGSVLFQSGKVVAAKQKHCQSKVTNYAENISVHAEKLSESVPRDILISKPEISKSVASSASMAHRLRCLVQSTRRPRQFDQEGCSRDGRIFHHYRAAVVVNDFTHDGQSQPGSVGFPEANEGIKQRGGNGGRDPGPMIDDANFK